jgi:hypothetical protein
MAEVAVVGCFRVNGATETELANDFGRAEVESFMDCFFDFTERDFFGAKRVEAHGNRVGMSDGVGELDLDPVGQARRDDIFGDVAAHIRGTAIYLGGVFAAESPASVSPRTAIGVDDNFAAC